MILAINPAIAAPRSFAKLSAIQRIQRRRCSGRHARCQHLQQQLEAHPAVGAGKYHKLTHASSDLFGVEVGCVGMCCLRSLILFHFVVIT